MKKIYKVKYLRTLLENKLNKKKGDPIIDKIIGDLNVQDTLNLMALENKNDHNTINKILNDLTNQISNLEIDFKIDKEILELDLDTVQAKSFKECIPKMIEHESEAHPEMEHKQIVAIAFEKCREKFGVK